MLLIAKKYLDKLTILNANFIYFICICIALIITIANFYNVNFRDGIEVSGTFIQIALPCYVLVPVLVKKDLQGAKSMLLFLALVLISTYALKIALPFKRPYGGSMSFPSGHTVGAFCGAVFLSFRYGKKYILIPMLLAFFVAFSRVYSNNHWPIDVCASILLCFAIGILIVRKI